MELNDVKVVAYLNPHPTHEDSCVEIEHLAWIPSIDAAPEREDEDEHPIYREENLKLYDELEAMVEGHFRKGLANMLPLLDRHHFKTIWVGVDLYGFLSSDGSSASYYPYESRPHEGVYFFSISTWLLRQYLTAKMNNTPLSFHSNSVWEHELIHLLDHWTVMMSSVYQKSDSIADNFRFNQLKYRVEGVAELYELLSGQYDAVRSVGQAKMTYLRDMKNAREIASGVEKSSEDFRERFYSSGNYYSVGPWLVMDLLRGFEGGWHEEMINEALESVKRKEPLPLEKIHEIIKIALRIDTDNFLFYLTALEESADEIMRSMEEAHVELPQITYIKLKDIINNIEGPEKLIGPGSSNLMRI